MKEQMEKRNSIGHWCSYCKDDIFEDDNYLIIGGTDIYYHTYCFQQEHNGIELDDFGEPNDQNNLD